MKRENTIGESGKKIRRRDFIKGSAAVLLGTPALWAQTATGSGRIKTNIDHVLKIPKPPYALPGLFPGRVVQVHNAECSSGQNVRAGLVRDMFRKSIMTLTGSDMKGSFNRFFSRKDVVGIKVNPVGAGLISTRLEVVDAIVEWLDECGLPRNRIVIWDRFDFMLKEAGFTEERYPGVAVEGLQTMDVEALQSQDHSRWLTPDGHHVSEDQFDRNVYYWADVEGPEDPAYLNQHVFRGKYSYFGKLITQRLTRIINVPVFKNTGNGISMATKNLGYGSICNTNRLHQPLFFDVCTEVLAFPAIRDKLALNITDGIIAQYEGGPGPNANFIYNHNTLYAATDPFALDSVCQVQMAGKRKSMGIRVNEHPRFTEYLRYAERLNLGVADPGRIDHIVT